MDEGRADIFLTYCTNAISAQKEVPRLQLVAIPTALQVSASYGLRARRGDAAAGTGDSQQPGAHCDLCGALGWTLPPLAVASIPCFAGHQVAAANFPAAFAVTIAGLPFSRSPPALLS